MPAVDVPMVTARMPPAEIYSAIKAAAIKWGVPWTFLAATAFVESNYDPNVSGPETKEGWRARGLFQLSPATIERYKVANPFNPEQAANAAAEFISHLAKGTGYDWMKVSVAYVWGAAKMVQAVNDGKAFPGDVVAYAQKVNGVRRWLQDQVKPAGGRMWERINAAILGLARANPKDAAAQDLKTTWVNNYMDVLRKEVSDVAILEVPIFKLAVSRYAEVYDRAPNTDGDTPPPWSLAPSLWDELIERIYPTPRTNYSEPAAGGGGLALLLILGGLLITGLQMGGRRR